MFRFKFVLIPVAVLMMSGSVCTGQAPEPPPKSTEKTPGFLPTDDAPVKQDAKAKDGSAKRDVPLLDGLLFDRGSNPDQERAERERGLKEQVKQQQRLRQQNYGFGNSPHVLRRSYRPMGYPYSYVPNYYPGYYYPGYYPGPIIPVYPVPGPNPLRMGGVHSSQYFGNPHASQYIPR